MTKNNLKEILGDLTKLDQNIKLYIPSTVNVDKSSDNGAMVKETLTLFSQLFGGATEYKAKGGWVSNTAGLVVEDVNIIEAYTTADKVRAGLIAVRKQAEKVKKEMDQEAVSLEYNGQLYFI